MEVQNLDDGMDTVEQLTPSEGSRETVSSIEIGGQSILWKGRATTHGQPVLAEIHDEETAGSPQFISARLEEPLDDEQLKIGKDDTSRVDPTHQPVLFWTNVSLIMKSHFISCPKEVFHCTKRRNVFSGTNG